MVAFGSNQTYAIYLYADGLMEWVEKEDSREEGSGDAKVVNSLGAGYQSQNTSFYFNDSRTVLFSSNVGCPGMWVFRIDEEERVLPESGNNNNC